MIIRNGVLVTHDVRITLKLVHLKIFTSRVTEAHKIFFKFLFEIMI